MSKDRSIHILVIDDEADIGTMIIEVLGKMLPKVSVQAISNSNRAEEILTSRIPDLVVLDLIMPGTNGFKICEWIRNDDRFRNTRILIFTGQDTLENRAIVKKLGADEYLPKPYRMQTFLTKVCHLLNLNQEYQK